MDSQTHNNKGVRMMGIAKWLRSLFLSILSICVIALPAQAVEERSRTLASGASFQGTNGIRVAPDGLVYVTSAVGNRINALDPSSGEVLRSMGPTDGVFGPDDLAFGPGGRLYWTAFFTGEVMRFNAAGEAEVVARVGPGVNAITFSASGRLFVSRVFLADELYEIDPAGLQPPRLVRKGLGGLNAMDFGQDGYLYGPLWFKKQIARIDVDSGEVVTVADGLDTPAAVKFSPAGVLHAIDQHEGELLRIDIESGEKHVVAHPGPGSDNLDFDAKGFVYITNAHEGSVSKVMPGGAVRTLSAGGLNMPAGIAIDSQGELVIAASQSLRYYDAQTGAEGAVIHAAIGDFSTVSNPLTVSAYGDRLLTTSWFSNAVQIWDPSSRSVAISYRDFQAPLNAVSLDGDIIVAELGAHRVVRRKPGTMDKDVLMAGIPVPTGLAATNGRLFVADWLTGNIYQLMAGGQALETPHLVMGGLKQPEGMALDNQGRLLVMEVGEQRLLRIDPANPRIEVLKSGLAVGVRAVPGYPPTWLLSSVAVDDCGRITVTQDLGNSLLRIVPEGIVPGVCGAAAAR